MMRPTTPQEPARWSYPIDSSMPSRAAVGIILRTLLEVLAQTEVGVLEGGDPESLHDYRVAVRRTRSALSLFGESLPPVMRSKGRRFFKDLGRRTTEARDLDVLLEALPHYSEVLPRAERAGLEDLESRIAREGSRRYAAIRRWLRGKTYCRGMISWRADLERLASDSAGVPMAEFAVEAIRGAAHRATEEVDARGNDPAAALHRQRIRFKKLRYALEFSAALTPGGEIDRAILLLKKMQDRLGTHQDLAVHERWIVALCPVKKGDSGLIPLGKRLTESLSRRRSELRDSIEADSAMFRAELELELGRALTALISE